MPEMRVRWPWAWVLTTVLACGPGEPGGRAEPTLPFETRPRRTPEHYQPSWSSAQPREVIELLRAPERSDAENGAVLREHLQSLEPGQRLEIGGGVWSIAERLDLSPRGTPEAPIWIVARPGETPVLTRPDERQNVLNLGSGAPARFVGVRGLEIRGGSEGIKLYDCRQVWIDGCHIHDVASVGISANAADTSGLYLTRNRIHDTGGTGEGIYLGANDGRWSTSDSVVAQNHVHDTGGSQGDGIELKQGSSGNWIVENLVHGTPFPCILVYGTGGGRPIGSSATCASTRATTSCRSRARRTCATTS